MGRTGAALRHIPATPLLEIKRESIQGDCMVFSFSKDWQVTLRSGMSVAEFLTATRKVGVSAQKLASDKYKIPDAVPNSVFYFEKGKLALEGSD